MRGEEVGGEADGGEGPGGSGADGGDANPLLAYLVESVQRDCRVRAGLQVLRLRLAVEQRGFAQDDRVLQPHGEGFDGVGAGEEEPVEASLLRRQGEGGERGVEGGEGGGVGEFDGGDEDGVDVVGAQGVGELGGLVGGAGYEDAVFLQ